MPTYIYKALSVDGKELIREATAPDEMELRQELEGRGVLVRSVRVKRGVFFSIRGQSVKPSDLLQANQEMITLLKAGLTVPEALDMAADQPESPAFSAILRRVLENVKTGDTLSAACAKYRHVFDGLYLASLKTGERTGNLAMPLARYQNYLRQRVALSNKVSQAMVYPIFLVFVLAMVLGLLFTFVMPRFTALYTDFNTELPLPTRILMDFVHHLPVIALLSFGVLLAVWGIFKGWTATGPGALSRDRALRTFPFIKDFVNPFLAAQLARTLATLLSG
ncbi:MAG: type II secretion system F family protein, partial [bacterium]